MRLAKGSLLLALSWGSAALAALLAAALDGRWLVAALVLLSDLLGAAVIALRDHASRATKLELEAARGEIIRLEAAEAGREESALALGSELGASAGRSLSLIHRLEGLASGTADGIAVLDQSLATAVSAQESASSSYERLKEAVSAYSQEVSVESAAVEAMVGSVGRLAASSSGKDREMGELLGRAGGAEEMLRSIQRATGRIMESARKTAEMSSLISDLSERTNLLAINASIEAAHAGKSGAGFAIVAAQIRSLSEESQKNSKAISSAIAETLASIEAASGAANGAADYFKTVVGKIGELDGTFERLLAELQGLSENSSELLDSISLIGGLNEGSGKALECSAESIAGSRTSLLLVREIASTMRSDADAMMAAFKESVAEISRAKSIGERASGEGQKGDATSA